ncbi:hypothetical protein BASA61_003758 [Batrachochytrium salamandrivorans]|nr:hypothetical protein BASA61_003758 [Batrachochytrium salamandrivorans]
MSDCHIHNNDVSRKWMADWTARLKARDNQEKAPFVALFPSYNDAMILAESRAANIAILQSQLAALRIEAADAAQQLAHAKEIGNPDTAVRLVDLENQVMELKDERNNLYKTNASSSQRVLSLIDASHANEEKLKSLVERSDQLSTLNKTLTTKLTDSHELLKEKDHVILILKDELSAHQLELVQREEQLEIKKKRVDELELDNKNLLDRWIMLKQREATHMNEANEIMASALKSKTSIKRKESFLGFPLFLLPSSPTTDQPEEPRRESSSVLCSVPVSGTRRMTAHDGDINCISISRDGSMVATGANDRRLIIYDGKTCSQKAVLDSSIKATTSVSFNSACDLILSTSIDQSIKVWSTHTYRPKVTFTGHTGKVCTGRFTDNNCIISGSHDRTIKIWDLVKGYCVKTIFTLSSCNDLALFGGEGEVIVSGHLDNNLHSLQILTTSRDNTLQVLDVRTYKAVATYAHEGYRTGMNWTRSCFSPNGAFVSSGSADGTVFFWDTLTGEMTQSFKEHKSPVWG